VDQRTVRRWIHPVTGAAGPGQRGVAGYALSSADREAFAHFRGNVAAVHRARDAVTAGAAAVAGVPVPASWSPGGAGPRRCR
jgi:putative transposase